MFNTTFMLKAIIGMANRGYGYDYNSQKSKDKISREIAEDLKELGLTLSLPTLRSYLKEGEKLLRKRENEI